jgi:hypothetical protein
LPHPNMFRPCRSSRLRRFAPHTASQVCCTLQPVIGFAWFRADRVPAFAGWPTLLRGVLPLEALRRTSGLPVARLPASSPLVRGNRSYRVPRPRGVLPIRSSTRATLLPACTSSLGFPRPRPSPEVSVAGGSRWFPRCPVPGGIGSPHSGRCARRGRLPVALLAGCDRGARDGYRVSHGHRAVARTPRMLLPAHGSSNDPFEGIIHSRVSGPVESTVPKDGESRRSCPGAFTEPVVFGDDHRLPRESGRTTEPKLRARRGKSRGLARQRPRERGVGRLPVSFRV